MAASGKVLEALTAIPHDDVAWATAAADFQPNIRQRMVSAEGMTPLDILPVAHSLAHSPVHNPADLVWTWQMTSRAAHNRVSVILCADHGNQSISYAGDLCDANFIRLRRIADAAQHTWDRVRCIGTDPRATNSASSEDQRNVPHDRGSAAGQGSSGREMFTRAMTTPHTAARLDFMAQFGVEWLDPTADRKLLERLLTFPLHIFRVGNRPQGLARELGRGRLPDNVRLRRGRASHSPDQVAWFARRADDYRRAFASLRDSSVCAAFLDLSDLEPALTRLCAGNGSPTEAAAVHRVLDAGLFARVRESGQSPGQAQRPETGNARTCPNIPTLQVFGTGEVDSAVRARA
jgi:asparagine synthase (glutamine-hydrolysing)